MVIVFYAEFGLQVIRAQCVTWYIRVYHMKYLSRNGILVLMFACQITVPRYCGVNVVVG